MKEKNGVLGVVKPINLPDREQGFPAFLKQA